MSYLGGCSHTDDQTVEVYSENMDKLTRSVIVILYCQLVLNHECSYDSERSADFEWIDCSLIEFQT